MKKLKRFLALALAVITVASAFALTACGDKTGKDGDVYTLEFYRTRANNMTEGTYEAEVTAALEEKFFADTGTKIKLVMNMMEAEDLEQKINVGIGNSKVKIDAFCSQLAADSSASLVYKYCSDSYGSAKNLQELVETHAPDFMRLIRDHDEDGMVERSGYFMINGEMQFKALPSVYNTNYYAMMLRKDYWREAYEAGKTALNPEDYDTSFEGYKRLTLAQFEEVMTAIKQTEENVTYPVTGFSWDIARTIGASCFNTMLNWVVDENGKLMPYQFSEEYGELLELCRKWASNGIWEKDSSSTTDDTRTNNFLAGKHAAYLVYPDVEQLINISNRLSAYDATSECMLIAPLKKDEQTETYGFYTQPAAFQGLCIPFDGNNTEVLLQFINWLYRDAENYELAKYGIKGEHWVEGQPYTATVNGKSITYKTWAYPTAKIAEYSKNRPYSGCWELLVNVNLSERLNDMWSPNQKRWYVYSTQECEGQSVESSVQGIMLPEVPVTINSGTYQQAVSDAAKIYGNAVAGKSYGAYATITEAILAVKEQAFSTASEILNFYQTKYDEYIDWFSKNL
ncbi:MAG: hypothetical protein IJF71_01990 [Clostridia bacterium]|nr:hypothetical protein [Clostridia bacterium]